MPLAPGTGLGPYRIDALLGAGGMGEVYRARDTRLDRTVAIKLLPSALAGDPEFRERFDREARAISQLTHANVCTLHDVGEAPARPDTPATHFLVMKYLEGERWPPAWRADDSPCRTPSASVATSPAPSITRIATASPTGI